jgi:PAS domain-containing protein
MVCAVAGLRLGVWVAGMSGIAVLVLGIAQYGQWWPSMDQLPIETLVSRSAVHLLLVLASLAGGTLVSRLVSRYVQSAEEREHRFRGLLAIAADAYWEIDDRYRLVTFSRQADEPAASGSAEHIGEVPWEVDGFDIDDETLDLLRAQLEAREPFRDLPVRWLSGKVAIGHFLISGEPRHNLQGTFQGYWGVARDVSADVQARQALQATETRYQELFTCIPTPLVLHGNGRVFDANPAALALFGHADLRLMAAEDLLAAYESGDSRERERRRLETLHSMQPGEALPVAEFRLVGRDGRRTVVRATTCKLW